jgi:hypothetical protein
MASLWIAHSHGADGTAQRQIQALVGVSWSGQDRSTCLLEDERRATSSPRGAVSRRGVICSPHGGGGGVRRRSVWQTTLVRCVAACASGHHGGG